jgi:hypothetical protein
MSKKTKIWITVAIGVTLASGLTGYLLYRHNHPKPSCANPAIKGNISYTTGAKIYHLPGDDYYKKTVIDTSSGERWFCTAKEARDAGWRASGR